MELHENISTLFLERLFNTLYLQDISDYYLVTTRDPLTTKASNLEVAQLAKNRAPGAGALEKNFLILSDQKTEKVYKEKGS